MAKLSPVFNDQTVDVNGNPLSGAQLFTYVAGSSTKVTTYTDSAGLVPQTNPIILNSLGYPTNGPIWIAEGTLVKFVLAPSTDTDPPTAPIRTIPDVQGVNDASVTLSQWTASGVAPTYVSANSFTLVGDQTSKFEPGMRAQFTTSGGTVYGNILTSVFTTITTVTMQMDGTQVLDSGLSVVNLSILLSSPSAEPSIKTQSFQMGSAYGNFSIITAKGVAIAGAPTTAIFSATDGNIVDISGSGWICTSLGTALIAGQTMEGTITGSGTFTQSTNLNLGGASVTVSAGWKYKAFANTTTQIDLVLTPPIVNSSKILPITAAVSSSALTVSINPCCLDFRSSVIASGSVNTRTIAAPISMVVSSGSTLGTTSAVSARLAILAIDNSGTIEVAIVNAACGLNLDETGLISTTAEGGSGAADSASIIYSTTARTNLPYRLVGYLDITQTTAGTWASVPTTIQGYGGQSFKTLNISSYPSTLSTSGATIDFGSIPPNTKRITINFAGVSTNGTSNVLIQMGTSGGIVATGYIGETTNVFAGTPQVASYSTGFAEVGGSASASRSGSLVITRLAGNLFCLFGIIGDSVGASTKQLSGYISLSAELTSIRVTTTNGTDLFDSGIINVLVE